MKKLLIFVLTLALVVVVFVGFRGHSSAPSVPIRSDHSAATKSTDSFNKQQYSTDTPGSIWVVVNKKHPLQPTDYVPSDLTTPNVPLRVPGNVSMQMRQVTAGAIETMFAAAKKDTIDLMISSAYRSYSYQVGLYNSYVASSGQAAADTISARPGYSEHQTGLAVDLEATDKTCEIVQCFGDTPAGKWLAAHAYTYGFILRYTPDGQSITGYESEPWHYRYVGTALAAEMHAKHITTLEQFFDLSGGTYSS